MPAGMGEDFDPDDPAALEDPERVYGSLRARCPVAHSNRYGGFWAVTRYRDVERVMTDPATFTSSRGIIVPRNPASGRRPPLHYDPPEHTDYRRAINPVFRKDRLRRLEPIIRRLATETLPEPGTVAELYTEYCSPLTARVVCALLNIPEPFAADLVVHMETFEDAQRRRDVDVIERENRVLYDLSRAVVAERSRNPLPAEEDLVSGLLAAEVGGEVVTAETAAGSLRQIVVAGHGAPALVLASAALYLARDVATQERLRHDRTLVAPFVEEMLRLHTPNVGFARTTTRSVTLGGRTIPAREPVAVVLPAANRDPELFERASEVVLGRSGRHLAFGCGPHVCPGSIPGRAEVAAGVDALLDRSPFVLFGEIAFSPWPTAGPVRLPLRFAGVPDDTSPARSGRTEPIGGTGRGR